MSLLKPALLVIITFTTIRNGHTQDKLYFTSNTNQGNVQNITSNTVTFTPLQNAKPVKIETKTLLLVFNKQGNYLVPSRMDFSGELSNQLIQAFLSRKSLNNTTDQIYTADKKILQGKFISEDKNFVYYTISDRPARIEKAKVVAIIFKDGHHLIYRTASEAAETLWSIQRGSALPGELNNGESERTVKKEKEANRGDSVTITKVTATNSTAGTEVSKIDSIKPLTFEEVAPNVPKAEFEKKAEHKTRMFGDYLKILCDKSKDLADHNKAIEQAVSLFVNENATVETSSVNRIGDTKRQPIRQYLKALKMLEYDKIELTWTSVQYVSDVRLAPDGNYYGTVTFEQVFKGYDDNKVVYQDITRKNATVILKTYDKTIEGSTQKVWDILLGDVGVKTTKSIKPTE